jgi:hypothetical protein
MSDLTRVNVPNSITLFVHQDGEDPYIIGTVRPPADKYSFDPDTIGQSHNIHYALDMLWRQWREEVPIPDADSEFVKWLIDRGWTELSTEPWHTFET